MFLKSHFERVLTLTLLCSPFLVHSMEGPGTKKLISNYEHLKKAQEASPDLSLSTETRCMGVDGRGCGRVTQNGRAQGCFLGRDAAVRGYCNQCGLQTPATATRC